MIGHMNKSRIVIGLLLLATALSGCSMGSSMLNRKANVPQADNVQVGNDLAMPNDLQLPPPGQGADVYQQPVDQGLAPQQPMKKMAATPLEPVAPAAPAQDIYERNGISRIKDDGTAKTTTELKIELKAALLRKKQQTNPGYGTFKNFRNIFSDQ